MISLDSPFCSSLLLAESAGFCPGVQRAVQSARNLCRDKTVSRPIMLGELVHNEQVTGDLINQGFRLVQSVEECQQGDTVLIRAHGITQEAMKALQEKSCLLVDETCPFVRRIQMVAAESKKKEIPFFLAGTAHHPEVVGILSQAGSWGNLIETIQDAEKVPDGIKKGVICAQTTFSVDKYEKIKEILKKKIEKTEIFDTICATTVRRQTEAVELAQTSDLILVLGSDRSSNTGKLMEVCQRNGCETLLVQRPDQVLTLLKKRDLRQMRIGITAGASTPERLIREVIQVMTEEQVVCNEQQNEETLSEQANEPCVEQCACGCEAAPQNSSCECKPEAAVEEKKEMSFSDYIEDIPQLKRGAIVNGTLVRFDDEFVYVDVHDKSEGKVPRSDFTLSEEELKAAVEAHETVEVYVRMIKNSDMGKEILLSKSRVDFAKQKEEVQKAFEERTPITVKVTGIAKDGLIASYGTVDLYIHRTQIESAPVEDLEPYKGQTFEVVVTQFDPNGKRLRVSGSRRALVNRERRKKAKEIWESIEVGKEYDGVVRNITDFGAFVDLGGVDGLVHISELSWGRIKHPSEVCAIGDQLHVFVKDFDAERHRISLGYRLPEQDPYYQIEERFPLGSIVRGIVVRMFNFGAFIEIAPGLDALCHISQISNYHLNRPDDVLQEGMEVDARVLEVSNADRKISISIKEVEPIDPENPEELRRQSDNRQNQGDDQERSQRPRRNNKHNREEQSDADQLPTAYTDTPSGSSLSALADFTVASEEGAEVMKELGLEE